MQAVTADYAEFKILSASNILSMHVGSLAFISLL